MTYHTIYLFFREKILTYGKRKEERRETEIETRTLRKEKKTTRSGFNIFVVAGYAVTGLLDPTNRSLSSVSLAVSSWSEPDLDQKQPPVLFNATVRVKGLTLNQSYVLLRWDDPNPCAGCPGTRTYVKNPGIVKLTGANYTVKFRAQSEEWEFADPVRFLSSGATYYRCVVDNGDTL